MNHRTHNTANQKSQQNPLPSQNQPTGKHHLHITAANSHTATDQINHPQHPTDTNHANQMPSQTTHPIQPGSHNAQHKQKNINPKRNLKSPPVNHTQHNQSRPHQTINKTHNIQPIHNTNHYIEDAIDTLYDRILYRNLSLTKPALPAQHDPGNHRNHIKPPQLPTTTHAVRRRHHHRLPQRKPVNADI